MIDAESENDDIEERIGNFLVNIGVFPADPNDIENDLFDEKRRQTFDSPNCKLNESTASSSPFMLFSPLTSSLFRVRENSQKEVTRTRSRSVSSATK